MTPTTPEGRGDDQEARRRARKRLFAYLKDVPSLRDAFSTVDPYAPSFQQDLTASLNHALAGHWSGAQAQLGTMSPESALRHAWAVATESPLALAALARSALASDDAVVRQLAAELLTKTDAALKDDVVARAVAFPPALPPDFTRARLLMPGMSLRYLLAACLDRGLPTKRILELAQGFGKASPYLKRRELERMIAEARKRGTRLQPLGDVTFLMQPRPVQQLLISSSELGAAFLPRSIVERKDLQGWVEAACRQRDEAKVVIKRLVARLAVRDFAQVAALISSIAPGPLEQHLFAEARKHRPKGPAENDGASPCVPQHWVPLSVEAIARLRELQPRSVVPEWWGWTAPAIAGGLAAGTLPLPTPSAVDLEVLRRSWGLAEERLLVAANRSDALGSSAQIWREMAFADLCRLADTRADFPGILAGRLAGAVAIQDILVALGREQGGKFRNALRSALVSIFGSPRLGPLVLAWIGTPEWNAAGGWKLHDPERSEDLAAALSSKFVPIDRAGCNSAIVAALTSLSLSADRNPRASAGQGHSPEELLRMALRQNPALLPQLVVKVSPAWLRAAVAVLADKPLLLDALQGCAPPEVQEPVFTARALHAATPVRLLGILEEGARRSWATPWHRSWLSFASAEGPRSVEGLAALVLALRGDLRRLRRAARYVPRGEMRAAVDRAVAGLAGAPKGQRSLLELVRELGLEVAPHLAAVVCECDRSAQPGKRLDHLYRQWTLPKKSGGVRVISVPSPSLMAVQRAIHSNLLAPTGAHACACGFVKGRSIRDNARAHVGQPIVANADVKNCFPSVRWPLVLGALRRDLSARLSAGAIGMLVDICTAEGGLPIGAPTSPALLNRVLLRTDEILSAQAERRSCCYTRYADDLTFSGGHGAVEMLGVAKGTLGRIGLELDPAKTNIFRRGRRQVCTGLVVNDQVSVPRRLRRRMRAAVHAVERGRESTWHGAPQTAISLAGRLSFLRMIHTDEGQRLEARLRAALQAQARSAKPPKKARPSPRSKKA